MNLIISTNKIVINNLIKNNKFFEYFSDNNYDEYISNKIENIKIIIIKNQYEFNNVISYHVNKYNPKKIFLASFCSSTNDFYEIGDIIIPSHVSMLNGDPTTWDSKKKLPSLEINKSFISSLKMFAELASIDLYISKHVTLKSKLNSTAYKSWIYKNYDAASIDNQIFIFTEMLEKIQLPFALLLSVQKAYDYKKKFLELKILKRINKNSVFRENISQFLEIYSSYNKN